MQELDRRLATIASGQRQLITLSDVRRCGGNEAHAKIRCDAGRWVRLDHGVYLINGAPLDWHARLLARILAAGPGAVASHLAAARVWAMPGFARARIELSVPRGRRYRRADARVHESTDLGRTVHRRVDQIPVTDPARTLLDLARYVGPQRLARAIEWCRRQGLVTWSDVIRTLHTHARRGRPGSRRLRQVILEHSHRDEITDSDFELLVLELIISSGLPEPVLHHKVHDGERFVAEVDMAYPERKVGVECLGPVHREDEQVWERDPARRNDLVLCGWTLLEFTWKRVRSRPDRVIAELRDALNP